MSRVISINRLGACICLVAGTACLGRGGYDGGGRVGPPLSGCQRFVFDRHAYDFCPDLLGWDAAQRRCESAGANLATIDDATENSWADEMGRADYTSWWIGLNDIDAEGTYRWVDGSPVVFTKWRPGEPNDAGDEDCVHTPYGGAGLWNDTSCGADYAYLCEY